MILLEPPLDRRLGTLYADTRLAIRVMAQMRTRWFTLQLHPGREDDTYANRVLRIEP